MELIEIQGDQGGIRLTASLIALKAFLGLLARQALPIVPQQIHHDARNRSADTSKKRAQPADVCALNPLEKKLSLILCTLRWTGGVEDTNRDQQRGQVPRSRAPRPR